MNKDFNELNGNSINSMNQLNVSKKTQNYFDSYKWIDWFALACFCIFSVSTAFVILDIVQGLQANNGTMSGWDTIDKFTDQSNVLLWLFMLFYLFFRKHSFLKNNQWFLANMMYIFFTFIGYNVILVGIGGYSYSGSSFDILKNVWYHILSPLLYLGFGFCYFWVNPNQQPKSYWISMLKALIYPTIYVIYTATIPFVVNPIYNGGETYTVYGSFTNTKDNVAIALPVILVIWLIFFPGSYAIFYYSWKGFNKLNNKKAAK